MNPNLWWVLALGALNLVVLILWWLSSRRRDGQGPIREHLADHAQAMQRVIERLERELRDEVARTARGTRQELATTLAAFQRTLLTQQGDVARTQNEQIDSFRTQLAAMQQLVGDTLRASTETMAGQASQSREAQDRALQRFGESLGERLKALSDANERRLAEVRATVEQRLAQLAADNEGDSFRQVAERLDQVHRGLGEMQALAQGVGDLKRVLTNVKTRGVFGEAQLAALLEQVFTPDQYACNVATVPGSRERVEFAIRLPGRGDDGRPVWLPLDAKFPREDYERLLEAQDRADREGAEAAARALEQRVRDEARAIATKYLAPPHTTDFAVLFVPTEGLYAELLRRPGLVEALQRERVTLAGPTTLLAMLNSLQMGFRTLALERRSSEVWKVLGAVKTEFTKFGEVLAKVKDQTQTVLNTLDRAETRTRQMSRALKSVEALPESEAQGLLPVDVPQEPAE
jgi:DNA recombination protein RmuC